MQALISLTPKQLKKCAVTKQHLQQLDKAILESNEGLEAKLAALMGLELSLETEESILQICEAFISYCSLLVSMFSQSRL